MRIDHVGVFVIVRRKGIKVSRVGDLLGPASCLSKLPGGGEDEEFGHKIDLGVMASSILCVLYYGTTVFVKAPIIALLGAPVEHPLVWEAQFIS